MSISIRTKDLGWFFLLHILTCQTYGVVGMLGWFGWYTETPIQIQQEFWSFLCYELLLSASLPLLYIKASVRLLLVLENLSPANQNGLHLFSQTGAGLELWLCYTHFTAVTDCMHTAVCHCLCCLNSNK